MFSTKQITLVQLIISCLLTAGLTQTSRAKSVYAVTECLYPGNIKAYKIQDNQIEYQTDVTGFTMYGNGTIGLTVDPESEYLFITFENTNIIELINAKTMQYVDTVTAPGASNLSGIVFDESKQRLYTVDRGYDKLFVYLWNPSTKTLTLEGDTYKTLENIAAYPDGAYGTALDEYNGLLYVTQKDSNMVNYYDTNDWSYQGSINVGRSAVGIAVDKERGYLYAGHWQDHTYLVKYDLNGDPNDPNTLIEKNIDPNTQGAKIIGLAVDQDTGLVYTTTYRDGGWSYGGAVEVWDTSNWTPDPNQIVNPTDIESEGLSGPAGICVPSGEVSYKPPFPLLTLVKDNNDPNDECVSPLISEEEHVWMETPYNWLYYKIEYDANGHSDTNVIITDYLPKEVNEPNFISDGGVYDSNMHTVTWNNIGDISASDSNTFWIQVAVNYYAKPGHKIYNYCEIESDNYFMFTTEDVNVCCYGGNIIYVDEDANDPNSYNNGTSWFDAYRDLQDAFHTARNCASNQIWVAEGTYKPTKESARSISFELLDDVAVYGGFPTGGGTWFERNPTTYQTILSGDIGTPNDLSDNSYHVVKCQDVDNAILDGFTITAGNADGSGTNANGGGIYCRDSNNLTVTNCMFSGNSADYGGGVLNYSSDPNITNCTFSNNSAREGGGGYNYYSDPNIINCTFTGNSAASVGGGMVNSYESSPTIINCIFSENSTTATGVNTYGGAICNWIDSDPNVTNCVFSGNTATATIPYYSYGGAIYDYNDSDPNVTNCIFSNNSASHGGGLFNESSDPNVNNCIFTNNTSLYFGGGIYNRNDSSPTVANCVFSGNSSDYYGGGMANVQSSSSVRNCYFSGNSAGWGGGMQNYNESSPTVTNCSFSGNLAGWGGGMQDHNESSPTVTNCTFSRNLAGYGGGMHNEVNSDPNVTNCIFWDNDAIEPNDSGDEIYNYDNNSDPNFRYCDIEGDLNGTGCGGYPSIGSHNIDEDPCFMDVNTPSGSWTANASYDSSTYQSTLTNTNASWSVNEFVGKFVDPNTSQYLQFLIVSNDVNTIKVWSNLESIAHEGDTYEIFDYHLGPDWPSPCIDAGDPNGDYTGQTDIDGEPRVVNGRVDIGADEYYWSPADFNEDETVNFIDYAIFASAWQSEPNDDNYNEDCDLEDNNSIDYKDLALFSKDWLWEAGWAQTQGLMMGRGMSQGFRLMEVLYQPAPAKKAQARIEPLDIEYILKWLDEVWLDEEVRKMISEDEWLKFIKSVGDSY